MILLGLWNLVRKGLWAVKSERSGGRFLTVEFTGIRNCLAACSCSAVQPREDVQVVPKVADGTHGI